MGPSTEYIFIGLASDPNSPIPTNFILPGDSGSMVFDDNGKWLGLARGGPMKHDTSPQFFAYITDAQAILDHLTAMFLIKKYSFELTTS